MMFIGRIEFSNSPRADRETLVCNFETISEWFLSATQNYRDELRFGDANWTKVRVGVFVVDTNAMVSTKIFDNPPK